MAATGPFHEGSIAVQQRTGEREIAIPRGAMIRHALDAPAPEFLAVQRTLAVATLDTRGRPWASFWVGSPGIVTSESDRVLRLARYGRAVSVHDPVPGMIVPGNGIGVLAIDLATRRRLRINGTITEVNDQAVVVTVREVFPNCPKYIQQRVVLGNESVTDRQPPVQGVTLDPERQALIAAVDTLFVASRHPADGVDVSHRGGAPGFVQVLNPYTLRLPDYRGNSMFQTLGNIEVDPHVGLVLVNFAHQRCLSLTGRAALRVGDEIPGHPSGGTSRYWIVTVDEWMEFPLPDGARFRLVETSPYNPLPSTTTV